MSKSSKKSESSTSTTELQQLGFVIVPLVLLLDDALSRSQKLLYIMLRRFADKDERCFPSVKRLSRYMGVTERTIQTLMGELENYGVIKREHRIGRTNIYDLSVYRNVYCVDSETEVLRVDTLQALHQIGEDKLADKVLRRRHDDLPMDAEPIFPDFDDSTPQDSQPMKEKRDWARLRQICEGTLEKSTIARENRADRKKDSKTNRMPAKKKERRGNKKYSSYAFMQDLKKAAEKLHGQGSISIEGRDRFRFMHAASKFEGYGGAENEDVCKAIVETLGHWNDMVSDGTAKGEKPSVDGILYNTDVWVPRMLQEKGFKPDFEWKSTEDSVPEKTEENKPQVRSFEAVINPKPKKKESQKQRKGTITDPNIQKLLKVHREAFKRKFGTDPSRKRDVADANMYLYYMLLNLTIDEKIQLANDTVQYWEKICSSMRKLSGKPGMSLLQSGWMMEIVDEIKDIRSGKANKSSTESVVNKTLRFTGDNKPVRMGVSLDSIASQKRASL